MQLTSKTMSLPPNPPSVNLCANTSSSYLSCAPLENIWKPLILEIYPICLRCAGLKTSRYALLVLSCSILSSLRTKFTDLATRPIFIPTAYCLRSSILVKRSLMILPSLSPAFNYSKLFTIGGAKVLSALFS